MRSIRNSLSRLFLNQAPRSELQHIRQLEKLQKAHPGRPFVFNEGKLRLMYFNKKCMQSAMRIDAPDQLVCGYTRTMMGFLLLHPAPRHILMIGLGGGSLVKFCYRHLPHCRITVLELNPDVIALREQFLIPADDERLNVIQCDAVDYLRRERIAADAILLDGYDVDGLVEELNTDRFYADCRRALTPEGVLVANIWGKNKVVAPMLDGLGQLFSSRLWWCRSPDSYNLIVFGSKSETGGLQTLPAGLSASFGQDFSLQLAQLAERLYTLTPGGEACTVQQGLPALLQHLAGLMVTDDKVARTYAEWAAAANA